MVSIEYIEFDEPEGRYNASALILKLFGCLLVIALGRHA